jgi:hypothetical protein
MKNMSVLSRDYGLKIISGGQTGADLAGLRAAQSLGLLTGGYAPKGFKTLKGAQPQLALFGLLELPGSSYSDRTLKNVLAADATVIIAQDMESSGTKLTLKYCEGRKPVHKIKVDRQPGGFAIDDSVNLDEIAIKLVDMAKAKLLAWPQQPFVLNIAGNSSKSAPNIFLPTYMIVIQLLVKMERLVSNMDQASDTFILRGNELAQAHIAMQLEDNFDHIPELDPRRALFVLEA